MAALAAELLITILQSLISNPSGWKLALETHYVAADGRIWGLGSYRGTNHIYEITPETNEMYRIKSRGVIEGSSVKVFGFNEYGQAVGRIVTADLRGGGFFWEEQALVFLGDLGRPSSFPAALNNLGQVVGTSTTESDASNAFLWEKGLIFNLNELVPPDSGVILTEAKAINDAGNIVCTYGSLVSGQWRYGVCLLVPVSPIPLQISHHELTSAGLNLDVQGAAGQPLAVEYTTDFVTWTMLATSTNLIGRRNFSDPGFRDANFRAYRARLLPP